MIESIHIRRTATAKPPARWRPFLGLWAAGALLTLALGACNAARQVPGEAAYAGDAVVDWAEFVVGAEPAEY